MTFHPGLQTQTEELLHLRRGKNKGDEQSQCEILILESMKLGNKAEREREIIPSFYYLALHFRFKKKKPSDSAQPSVRSSCGSAGPSDTPQSLLRAPLPAPEAKQNHPISTVLQWHTNKGSGEKKKNLCPFLSLLLCIDI